MKYKHLVPFLLGAVLVLASSTAFAQISRTNLSAGLGEWSDVYTVTLNPGDTLKVEISGGTGDADIYVRRGAAPTVDDYERWGRPWRSGNDEVVERQIQSSGVFHIAVRGYEAYSGVSLTITGGDTGGGGGSGTGRANKQGGEYAAQYGIAIHSPALGTTNVQLQQNGVDRQAHSSDYLPISKGALMKEKDTAIASIVSRIVERCDIFNEAIKRNARANLPTSKKFDSAVEALTGTNPGYTDFYERNHFDPNAPSWTGLCHNWAPAGVLQEIVQMVWESDMVVGDQPIGVGDYRELVTALLPRVRHYFVGARNNGDDDETESVDLDLADIVSSLQYALVDNDFGIVFDVTYTAEVWNQAVDKYTQTVTDATNHPAVAGLVPAGGRAKRVKLGIAYVVELDYAHRGASARRTMNLDGYLIEDANGNVIDSKWITPTSGRPDFLWIPRGLFQSNFFRLLKALHEEGTSVEDMNSAAEFCSTVAVFARTIQAGGTPSAADTAAVRNSLARAAGVIDDAKVDSIVRSTARRSNIDPSELAAAVSGP